MAANDMVEWPDGSASPRRALRRYHFMDIDENMFYLDVDNERVVSGDSVAADHDLGKREHTWQGPAFANQPSSTAFSGSDSHGP
jgi:hypothetical protein